MMSRWERITPVRYALLCSGIYGLLAFAWIVVSTTLAKSTAVSIEHLQRIELVKGFLFVSVTTGLFFLFSYFLFKRLKLASELIFATRQRVLEAERRSIAGLIAFSITHDYANLLTILRLNVERITMTGGLPEKSRESLQKIDQGITRMQQLVERLRHARGQGRAESPEAFVLKEAVEEAIGYMKLHAKVAGCRIECRADSEKIVRGYPILIHQVLMNLILNAAEAVEGKGKIKVCATRDVDSIHIEVHDSGPGVPLELREKVFEPFYSTGEGGSGLGLVSVRNSVSLYGGVVSVEDSKELGGALFKVVLPDAKETESV